MKVILLEDVKGKGKKDDIINVSPGYGNNYLIKNKLGVLYTEGSKKVLDKELEIRKNEEDALVESYQEIEKKLKNKTFKFKVKVGTSDRVFGSISPKQIYEKLKSEGYDIPKKSIKIEGVIDSLGVHDVLIELHKKVKFIIKIEVSK